MCCLPSEEYESYSRTARALDAVISICGFICAAAFAVVLQLGNPGGVSSFDLVVPILQSKMVFLVVEAVACKPCQQRFAKRRAKRNKDVPSFCYIFQIWGILVVAICALYYVNYVSEILNLTSSIDRSYVGPFGIADEAFENMTSDASDAEARKMMYDEWTCDESRMRISPSETCASPDPQGGYGDDSMAGARADETSFRCRACRQCSTAEQTEWDDSIVACEADSGFFFGTERPQILCHKLNVTCGPPHMTSICGNSSVHLKPIEPVCISKTHVMMTFAQGFFLNYMVFEQVETLLMFVSGIAFILEYA